MELLVQMGRKLSNCGSMKATLILPTRLTSLKKPLAKQKMSEFTWRSKINYFIAQRHSQQEFRPAVSKLIDGAHVDPLHLKNNACALVHQQLLNEVIAMSKLSNDVKFFLQVFPNSHFHRYFTAMAKCSLSRFDWIGKWFDETKANGKQFGYHFTGRDSRLFLLHFMSLISAVESRANSGRDVTILRVIAYICLCLRDCVSLFSRVEISDEQVSELKAICTRYFRANAIFFFMLTPLSGPSVTLSLRTPRILKASTVLTLALIQWQEEKPSMCSFPSTVLCKSNANDNWRISCFVLTIYCRYISETSHGLLSVKTINQRDISTIFVISHWDIFLARLHCNDISQSKTIYRYDISLQRSLL